MIGKPSWWDDMEARVNAVRAEDLPSTPWVLHASPDAVIGRSFFRGGPFVTVRDNEAFLKSIKIDVAQGWSGPRAKTGALQEDLMALKRAMQAEQERRSGKQSERLGLGAA